MIRRCVYRARSCIRGDVVTQNAQRIAIIDWVLEASTLQDGTGCGTDHGMSGVFIARHDIINHGFSHDQALAVDSHQCVLQLRV